MPGYTSSTTGPHLRNCNDGIYLWASSFSSYDADFLIPAYIRLDDQIAAVNGQLVYYPPIIDNSTDHLTSPSLRRMSSTSACSNSSASSDAADSDGGWGKQRGEFSEQAVSVELSPCGSRLIAVLPAGADGQEQVRSELDLDEILSCEDGEFVWSEQ